MPRRKHHRRVLRLHKGHTYAEVMYDPLDSKLISFKCFLCFNSEYSKGTTFLVIVESIYRVQKHRMRM